MRSTHLAYTIVHGYDSLGRTVSVKQPHHAMAAITEYEPNKNRVATTTDADGNPTSYEYGTSGAKKGKVTTITAPDTSTTTIDYDLLNRRTFVSGTGTSPVAYDYNAYGELWKMKTWRSGTPPTGGDVTTWDYQPSTGDRLGRPDTTTQVGGHSWAYTYDATTLRPDTETITYNTGAGILTRVIDRSFDSLLRPKGWQLKNGATIEYDFSRTYESAASRPESFTGSGPFFSGEGPSFTYSYVPAAPRLVQGFASGSTVGTLNAWEPNRDVLDYKQNTFGGSIISKYDYTVNDMSHRSAVAETGSAYAGSPSVGWGYNSRGEVTLHDHTTAAYDSVYEFDTIGNRTKAAGGTTLPGSPNHASNNLNQYTTIGGVSPGYDDDGNLTSDAGGNTHGSARTYQWDAENQLRQVSSGAVADYRYDPHGRRISKTAGGVTTWFVYDGWNLVAEYQSGALTRTHLWGLDLSGTTQGAGGVGGLLCTSIGGTKYYPLYDGNGNICQYLDGSGGIAAHYEYGPFGHLLNSPGTGSTPALFNFRFSTKFNDPETDFYYYGYRYYSSWMARWINRDPIEERGGLNLYGMASNNAIGYMDYLGMQKKDCTWVIIAGHGSQNDNPDSNAQALIRKSKPGDCDKLGFNGCHRKSMNDRIEKLHKGKVLPNANRKDDKPTLLNFHGNPFVQNPYNTGTMADDGVELSKLYNDTKRDARKELEGDCCKSVTIKIVCTSDDFILALYPKDNHRAPGGDNPIVG